MLGIYLCHMPFLILRASIPESDIGHHSPSSSWQGQNTLCPVLPLVLPQNRCAIVISIKKVDIPFSVAHHI